MSNIINQSNIKVNDDSVKIAFLGTPQFAVPILEKLAQSSPSHQNWCGGKYKPIAVFCAPDKPIGRKQILTPPPVKITAQKYDIFVYQPADVSSFKFQVSSLKPDLIISAAYGIILTKEILDAPRYGCLNIHPSLLPKYRGASPIQAAILNDDKETGVTIIKMDEKIDHGPIIASYKLQVTSYKFTTPELSQRLSEMSAQLLLDILPDWLTGKIQPQPQDESKATYTKIIKKENGLIDWKKPAAEIERQVRAYQPWPGAYTRIENKESRIMKILEADSIAGNPDKKPGEIFVKNKELAVQTTKDALLIKKLQIEGGKPMSAEEFLRGHREIVGQIFD